jgi:hypothetical protein
MAHGHNGIAWLVAAPSVALALACVVLTMCGVVGINPFWAPSQVTMSEAAAMRDPATVLVQIEQGQDPYSRYAVRAGIIDSQALQLTPVEAAVRTDRLEVAAVILGHGGAPSAERVCEWLKLAAAERAEEVTGYVHRKYPKDAATCK